MSAKIFALAILVAIPALAFSQTDRWTIAYSGAFKNYVLVTTDKNTHIELKIEGTAYSRWIDKKLFPGFKIIRDTVIKFNDPKLSVEYKTLLQKNVDANATIAMQTNTILAYQKENEELRAMNAEKAKVILDLRKYKDKLLKYKEVIVLMPRDSI